MRLPPESRQALARCIEAHPEAFVFCLRDLAEDSALRDDAQAALGRLDGGRISAEERADCEHRLSAFTSVLRAADIIYNNLVRPC